MTIRHYLLAALLFLMPIVAIIDGLAMVPMAIVLFLLLAWPSLAAIVGGQGMNWRAAGPSHKQAILIALLLTVWPVLTSLWSILPKVSFITSLNSGFLILLALLAVFLGVRQEETGKRLWPLFGGGIAVAALIMLSGLLPNGGLLIVVAALMKHDLWTYLAKDSHRGLCALSVLVWPAVMALWRAGKPKLAFLLPWLLLAAVMSEFSLSAKTGLIAGMIVFYGMLCWPRTGRELLIWVVPLMFMTWPLLFHTFEPQLRASVYNKLPMSSQHRIEIWHFAMEKWQEKPLLGWGVDSSRKIPGGEDDSSLGKGFARLPLHPHNLPINVLLEEGLIGFGFFGIALFLFVRRILPVNPMYPSALLAARAATLVSYLTVGMSGFGMWQGWWEATGLAAFLIVLLVD